MVLNNKTILQRASKQAKKVVKTRPSLVLSKQPVRGIPYVHGEVRISYMHF